MERYQGWFDRVILGNGTPGPTEGPTSDRLGADGPQAPPPRRRGRGRSRAAGREYPRNDLGNGRRLIDRSGTLLRYCPAWGCWLNWDNTRWRLDETGLTFRYAAEVVAEIAREGDRQGDESLRSFARTSGSSARLKGMLEVAQTLDGVAVSPEQLNADPWLLNTPDRTVDLRTGGWRMGRGGDLITQSTTARYRTDARCPVFRAFLDTAFASVGEGGRPGAPDETLITLVQRVLGYAITGDVREQKLVVFDGAGANGKSTILEAVLHAVGPDYGSKAPSGLLLARKGDRHPGDLAALVGKRLVVTSETPEGGRFDESVLKDATGGERLSARHFYGHQHFNFTPTHKLVLATNTKPQFRGDDHAMARRLLVIPFRHRFWDPDTPARAGERRDERFRQDKGLLARLKAEAEGILRWLVDGAVAWHRHGLPQAEAATQATEEYRAEQDQLGTFLEEYCVVDPARTERANRLYDRYSNWLKPQGCDPLSYKRFAAQLRLKGFTSFTNNGTCFRGFSLR
jgi:putative DNA primase/helicase